MNWLDANAEGLALLFWAGVAGILVLALAAVVEQIVARRCKRDWTIDAKRCERTGSQAEFGRRLRSGGVR